MQIGREAIERSGARELHEILRTLPGLTVQDYGGLGGLKTVSVRGLGAAHTAVCVDGVMLSDAQQGSIDLCQFDLDNTASLAVELGSPDEIFKPASAFVSGGVVSIAPKEADFSERATNTSAALTWGSFSTLKPYLRIEQRIAPGWALSAGGSFLSSDGDYPFVYGKSLVIDPDTGDISTETRRQRRSGSDINTFKSDIRLEGNTRLGGRILSALQWMDSERGLPGAVILYAQNPTERLHDRDLSARLVYDNTFGSRKAGDDAWKLRLSASYRRLHTRYTDTSAIYPVPVDDRYLQQSVSASAVLQRAIKMEDGGLRVVIAQDLNFSGLYANTPACPLPRRVSSVTSVGAQYDRGRLRATASATATLQYESIREATTAHPQAAPDCRRLSPSLSISYALLPGLRLRAFGKEGFRPPTFNDLYYDRVGSIHLVPEKALQTGAGVTWQGNAGKALLTFTADAYHNRVRDKIIAVPTMFVWRMRNLGLVRMNGVDVSAGMVLPLGRGWTLRSDASYSYLNAADISDPSEKNYGHQIQYTAPHSGAFSASLSNGATSLSYTLCAVGKRWFLPQNIEANALAPYFDHGIALRRSVRLRHAGLVLSAEALNLSGINYEIVRSYPMPGRQLRISLKITN